MIKQIIDKMSLTKLNVLHWHLSDDQGFRIESKKFPKLQEVSKEYYTQDEIRDICEYAKLRAVEIIPELDMPGHTSAILSAYPQYSCFEKEVKLASSGGIYPVILCAGKEETMQFLEELLSEVAELFPGERIHVGGDEAPKSEWKKCPHCQARMTALGISNPEDLQADFTKRVCAIIQKKGKQAICWNETVRSEHYPENIQVQYWTLQHRDSMEQYVNKGGKWIYSDMFELYLDYPYSMPSLKKIYELQPHLGKRKVGIQDGLLGIECCIWSEHIAEHTRLEELLFPRVFANAELSWSGSRDYMEFVRRLEAQLTKPLFQGVNYTPQSWWTPKGSKRRKEAIAYFTKMNAGMSAEVREQTVESAAPNQEFAQSFMNKFFEPLDIPFLLISMLKK